MQNFIPRVLFAALVAVCACAVARADLVWSADKGWEIKGGVLAQVIGETSTVSNALEAMNKAREAQENGSNAAALSYYKTVVADYPESIFAPEALYQMGVVYLKRGQFPSAYECAQEIVKNYPDYQNFKRVIELEFNIASQMQDGKTYYVWGWFPWFTSYKDIIKYYESVVKNAPYGDFAPIALMNISTVAEREKEYDSAFDALERVINGYPDCIFTSDAYMQMAKLYRKMVEGPEYDQNPTKNAISFYQDYITLFPKESEIVSAEEGLEKMQDILARSRLVIGDFFYYYRNNNPAAAIFYNETITVAPRSPAADEARRQLAKIDRGELAPMTPYDWFFGRYQKPSVDQFEDDTRVIALQNEKFAEMSFGDFSAQVPDKSAAVSGEYKPLAPKFGGGLSEYLFDDGFYEWTEEELAQ